MARSRGGGAVDLGGNSGFFSLSLVDEGLLSGSTVYDTNAKALQAGEEMALMMGLSDRVRFVQQDISLEWLGRLEPVDTVISLNLIHHAGSVFDISDVQNRGWQAYADDWLAEMRRIARYCVLGVGFKGNKPVAWDVPKRDRARIVLEMAMAHGWGPVYDANVQDIADFGVERANGLRSAEPKKRSGDERTLWAKMLARLNRRTRKAPRDGGDAPSKRYKYHLFVFE